MDVKLIMFKQNGQRKDIPVSQETTVIGRAPDCDLRIPLDSCSRRHAQLKIEHGDLSISDLGSANGTLVNNERITGDETYLEPGDRITIGPVVLTVQIDGEPADVQAPEAGDELVAGVAEDDDAVPYDLGLGGSGDEDPISALEALADIQEEKKKSK